MSPPAQRRWQLAAAEGGGIFVPRGFYVLCVGCTTTTTTTHPGLSLRRRRERGGKTQIKRLPFFSHLSEVNLSCVTGFLEQKERETNRDAAAKLPRESSLLGLKQMQQFRIALQPHPQTHPRKSVIVEQKRKLYQINPKPQNTQNKTKTNVIQRI
uniref:(northern house mosquito) hypothetical protein n=1 Tax=Culex pipiens TaxID=7175 RepID=A0A8D8CNT1_CULPI